MLPRADITGTRPTATIEPPTPVTTGTDARQETFNRLAQIALGRQLQAEVLSHLGDSTFLVRVADTTVRMNLPNGAKVGDMLLMTMLAQTPRPTFLLAAEPGSATATLSSAGRLVDSVLHLAQQEGAPTAVTGKVPLAPSPAALASPAGVPRVAAALHDMLEVSGLFYESHLQEWVSGSRPHVDLMREPQAQLAKPQPGQELPSGTIPRTDILTQGMPNTAFVQLINQMRALAANEPALADLLRELQAQPGNPSLTDADTFIRVAKQETMSAESIQLINQQLHVLEHGRVQWQGELFPGVPMEWEVSEDAPRGESDDAEPSWQSVVRFELPTLGTVAATLRLRGERVQVQIRTASEAAAVSLRAHGKELANALDAAGSPMDSLQITQENEKA